MRSWLLVGAFGRYPGILLLSTACAVTRPPEPPAALNHSNSAPPRPSSPDAVQASKVEEVTPPPPASLEGDTLTAHREPFRFAIPEDASIPTMGAKGQWLLLCTPQAPEGERLQLLNARKESHPTMLPVGRLLASSADGRYVVYEEKNLTWLFDAEQSTKKALSDDKSPRSILAAISFDGSRLALLSEGGTSIRLYSLSAGEPKFVETMTLPFATFELLPTLTGFVARWTDERRFLPSDAHCSLSGFPGHASGRLARARAQRETLRFSEGSVDLAEVPGFLFETSSGDLVRRSNGEILLKKGDSTRTLVGAECGGRLLGGDVVSERFAFVCEEYALEPQEQKPKKKGGATKTKLKFPIVVVADGKTYPLEAETMKTGVDIEPLANVRFLPLRVGAQPSVIDLFEKKLIALPAGIPLAAFEGEVLIKNGRNLTTFPSQKELGDAPESYAPYLVDGPYLATETLWLRWSPTTERALAISGESPLLLSPYGTYLSQKSGPDGRTLILRVPAPDLSTPRPTSP